MNIFFLFQLLYLSSHAVESAPWVMALVARSSDRFWQCTRHATRSARASRNQNAPKAVRLSYNVDKASLSNAKNTTSQNVSANCTRERHGYADAIKKLAALAVVSATLSGLHRPAAPLVVYVALQISLCLLDVAQASNVVQDQNWFCHKIPRTQDCKLHEES